MTRTYFNFTPDASVDINISGADAEVKGITNAVNQAIKNKTILLPEKRKSTFANYDEISVLDIFGALNY